MDKNMVYMNDGERQVLMKIVSSFTLDQTNYCWLKEDGSNKSLLFRFYPDGEDMVFESVEDPEEYKEAEEAYLDLISDRQDQSESE